MYTVIDIPLFAYYTQIYSEFTVNDILSDCLMYMFKSFLLFTVWISEVRVQGQCGIRGQLLL